MTNNALITLNTTIYRNEKKFLANALGEDMVMMDMDTGDFISMNRVGADIWNMTDKPLAVQDVVRRLLVLYNIAEDQCVCETLEFLEGSRTQNIFVISEA